MWPFIVALHYNCAAIQLPPPRFSHPFPGHVHVQMVNPIEFNKRCKGAGACRVKLTQTDCYILINSKYAQCRREYEIHEGGHCVGWPKTHPRW